MKTANETPDVSANPLGYLPVTSLIRKFAVPSIISLLVSAAYNITDQIFIGQVVGMYGNAATNVAFPITILLNALAQLIGVGAAANFNIAMGAKKQDDAKKIVGTALTLMSVCGTALMAIVLLFKTPLLMLCGATENVLPYAQIYMSITAIGFPFFLFTQAANQLIRADGSPMYSMFCVAIGAVTNIFLDWLFMFVFGWGIQGAAVATVIGQIISFIVCFRYFIRFKAFKIKLSSLQVHKRSLIEIVKLGASNCLNQLIMMVVNIVMNNTLTYYGALEKYGSDIPLAVSGVIAKLNTILISFAVGLAQGCQPILGFNMGAGNYARVKETYKKAVTAALVISIGFFLAFQLFPRQIISIFGSGDALYFEFAERYIRIFLMMVCVFGVQPLSVNYFSGIGNVRQGLILSLSRQGFLLLPLLIVLPVFLGLNGVLCAGPVADALACILSLVLVYRSFRKLTAMEKEAEITKRLQPDL